jgi:ankyrin repeat protein
LPAFAFASLLAGCASAPPDMNQDLIRASRTGDLTKVKTLINKGADLNAVDRDGWTPYLAASAEGNWRVMKLLADHGAKTDPGF